jgi:cell division septal protein FtsQ
VDLVHRRAGDRLLNFVHKVHRYRCRSGSCAWEGVLTTVHRRAAKGKRRMKPWMWLVVVVVALLAGLAMVAYFESRPRAGTEVEGVP